jgi:predicted transcriptional regulator
MDCVATKEILTVRVAPETREALDALAAAVDRDRSYLVNEALTAYWQIHRWHIEHIGRGLKEADAGLFAPESEITKAFKKPRRK